MIQLDTLQLKRLLQDAASAGATAAIEAMTPKENELTRNDVMRWLTRIGKPTTYVHKMEQEGLIHGTRKGTSKNSAIYYKRTDVHTAMQALNLFPIINQ